MIEDFVRHAGQVTAAETLDRDVHLFDEGYLDSLGTLVLIDGLERLCGAQFAAETLMDPRFSSVNGIAEIVCAEAG